MISSCRAARGGPAATRRPDRLPLDGPLATRCSRRCSASGLQHPVSSKVPLRGRPGATPAPPARSLLAPGPALSQRARAGGSHDHARPKTRRASLAQPISAITLVATNPALALVEVGPCNERGETV